MISLALIFVLQQKDVRLFSNKPFSRLTLWQASLLIRGILQCSILCPLLRCLIRPIRTYKAQIRRAVREGRWVTKCITLPFPVNRHQIYIFQSHPFRCSIQQLHRHSRRVCRTRNIIPTRIRHTTAIPRIHIIDRPCDIRPRKVLNIRRC